MTSLSVTFEFSDSCNCRHCCIPTFSNPTLYLNKQGELERFDKKKAKGDEHRQTYERMQIILKRRFEQLNIDSEMAFRNFHEISHIDLHIFELHSVPLTKDLLERINEALEKTVSELSPKAIY